MSAVPAPAEPVDHDDEDEEAPSVDLPPVADPADAEWRLRMLKRQQRNRKELQATYDKLVVETREWFDAQSAGMDAEIAEIERQLAGWLSARIELDPKGPKSVPLPSGKITSKQGSVVLEVEDEAAFLAWAREHRPELIATPAPTVPPPRPDKNAVKALGTAEHKYAQPGDYKIEVEIVPEAEDPLAEGQPDPVKVEIPGVKIVRKDRTVDVEWPEAL